MAKTKKKSARAPARETARGASKERSGDPCPHCGARAPLFWHGRRVLCETCIEERTHEAERGPITISSVTAGAVLLAREVGARAAAIAIAFALPTLALEGLGIRNVGVDLLLGLVQLVGLGAAMDLGIRVLDAEPPRVGLSLATGAKKALPLLLGMSIAQLIVFVHLLFLVVPGFVKALSYAVLVPLVVSDEAGPLQALSMSTKRMRGHRQTLFPLLFLVWLPGIAMALFDLAFNVEHTPIFPGDPEADALLRVAVALLYPVLELPWLFVALCLHAKLRHRERLPHAPAEQRA